MNIDGKTRCTVVTNWDAGSIDSKFERFSVRLIIIKIGVIIKIIITPIMITKEMIMIEDSKLTVLG